MAGLTAAGFEKKTLQQIKTEVEAEFRNTYGDDIDLSESSVAGQFIGIFSKKLANQWDIQEAVYNSFNPDNAENVSLDGGSALTGTVRLPALSTELYIMLEGAATTVVPLGHLVEQDETAFQFALGAAITIQQTDSGDVTFSVATVLDTQLYEITINTIPFQYTSDGTATAEEIVAGLIAAIDAGSEPVTTVDNLDGTGRIYATGGVLPFTLVLGANLALDSLATPARYVASLTGPKTTPLGTVVNIINPIAGLTSVSNIDTGVIGRDAETDEELRIRRRESVGGIGNATDESIKTKVLQEVDNVSTVVVISNRTDSAVGARPAHSFETLVIGGDEQSIADKIWEVQPSGIRPYGLITKTVVDSEGNNQSVSFSRPTSIAIWVIVEYELYPEEAFPNDGVAQIKQAIVDFASTEYDIGVDVIRKRLSIPIYSVPGVGDTVIKIGISSGTEAEVDIAIADNEKATFDINRISLNLV